MNRQEARNVLAELIETCHVTADAIMLMPPNADHVLSNGYQLHIKSNSHQQNVTCILPVLKKHNLTLVEEPNQNLLIIYKPATPKQIICKP